MCWNKGIFILLITKVIVIFTFDIKCYVCDDCPSVNETTKKCKGASCVQYYSKTVYGQEIHENTHRECAIAPADIMEKQFKSFCGINQAEIASATEIFRASACEKHLCNKDNHTGILCNIADKLISCNLFLQLFFIELAHLK